MVSQSPIELDRQLEIDDLRAVNAELELFSALVEQAGNAVALLDATGIVLYANKACAELYGYAVIEEFLGQDLYELIVEEDQRLRAAIEGAMQGRTWQGELIQRRRGGASFVAVTSVFGVQRRAEKAEVVGFMAQDISAYLSLQHELKERAEQLQRKQEELQAAHEEQSHLQEQVIAGQKNVIRELSTPVIPALKDILIMPLVGTVDSERARRVTDTVLDHVRRLRAQVVIIDVTGVPVVDTSVANSLLHAAEAIRLLGAETILVGITPATAQTIVQLGVNLAGLITRSDLQSGIEYALERLGLTIALLVGAENPDSRRR